MQSEFKKAVIQQWYIPLIGVVIASVALVFINKANKKVFEGVNVAVCNSKVIDSIPKLDSNVVKPVVFNCIPDLRDIHYKERMQKFIDMMLPSVLLACKKMDMKRERIVAIGESLNAGLASNEDSLYIENAKARYKTDNLDDIITRLKPHPVSIILAQAAIESGWATSRFCREGNNIFGIWSYNSNEKRIKAGESRGENDIYLRKYDTVFESIYDYLETIARANAYKQFREVRLTTDNPYRLIWYLNNYSEKRYEYVHTLRNVIEFNDLHDYDEFKLAKIREDDKIWEKLLD